jgi:hypothetical protein
MDEFDIAVLDMSAFEFKIECQDAYKHKGDGVRMHKGSAEATHVLYATCGYCGTKTEETNVCLNFVEEAYDDSLMLKWRCVPCRSENTYLTTLTIVGCI